LEQLAYEWWLTNEEIFVSSIFADRGGTPTGLKYWRDANWRERIGLATFYFGMWGIAFPTMCIGALMLLGLLIDGFEQRSTEHDRCLKQATNGYEIKQCH